MSSPTAPEAIAEPLPPSGGAPVPVESFNLARALRILDGEIRESDLLFLPPDAAAKVEREFGIAQALRAEAKLSEAERQRIRIDRTLEFHFSGQPVACLRTPNGVAVLAVGEQEIGALVEASPAEKWRGVVIEFPESW